MDRSPCFDVQKHSFSKGCLARHGRLLSSLLRLERSLLFVPEIIFTKNAGAKVLVVPKMDPNLAISFSVCFEIDIEPHNKADRLKFRASSCRREEYKKRTQFSVSAGICTAKPKPTPF
jgi:hypothetical protein